MKKLFTLIFAILPLASFAQSQVPTPETGTIVKYVEIGLPNIKTTDPSSIKPTIRYYFNEEKWYMCLPEINAQGRTPLTILVTYEDLTKVNDILRKLARESSSDSKVKSIFGAQHLENKYQFNKHLHIGYYINDLCPDPQWFIEWKDSTYDNMVIIKDKIELMKTFDYAQKLIEERRKSAIGH